MEQNEYAKIANERLYRQREAYQSTTAPLLDINNSLREIRDLLKELLKEYRGKSE